MSADLIKRLFFALSEADTELAVLRKDRRDSWTKDPMADLLSETRAYLISASPIEKMTHHGLK